MIDNTCHRKMSARENEKRFLIVLSHIIFVYSKSSWYTDIIKNVLTLLNVDRHRLLKVNGVNH
jgi:hypothetical protein